MPADRPLRLTSEIIEAILGRMIVILYVKMMLAQRDVCPGTLRRDLPCQFPREHVKGTSLIEGGHLDGVRPGLLSWLHHDQKLVSQLSVDFGRVTRLLRKLRNQLGAIGEKQEFGVSLSYSNVDLNSRDGQSKAEEIVPARDIIPSADPIDGEFTSTSQENPHLSTDHSVRNEKRT